MKNEKLKSFNGLRAIAIISVILFHINSKLLSGGFLGVELFFVLSGYLIVSKIIEEFKKEKNIDLFKFINKRITRILPAVYFLMGSLIIFLSFTNKNWLLKLKNEILHSLIFNTNYYYISNKVSYFEKDSISSPIKHLWSLSVEIKFYFLIFLIFLIVFRILKKMKKLRYYLFIMFLIHILLIIYSIFKMNINYNGIESIDRVYYGLDTRLYSFLIGATFSFFFPLNSLSKKESFKFDIISIIILPISIFLMFFVDEFKASLYSYGFPMISLIFAILAIVIAKSIIMKKIIGNKFLDHIGEISYGLYLWHFPVFILSTPYEEYFEPNIKYILIRVLVTYIITVMSYYLLEKPVLKGGIKKIVRKPTNFIGTLIFITMVFLSYFNFNSEVFSYRLESNEKIELKTEISEEEANKIKEEIKVKEEKNVYRKVILIGDSLGINISNPLSEVINSLIIDAKVGRQFVDARKILENYKEYNKEDTVLLIMLGSNGLMLESEIYDLKNSFDKADMYLINLNIPRKWNNSVNKLYKKVTSESDIKLIDWNSLSKGHREWFVKDRVHINNIGSKKMIELIFKSLEKKIEDDYSQKPILIIDHNIR